MNYDLEQSSSGHISIIRGFTGGILTCHCEESQTTRQSPKIETRLLRFARNDTKIRESSVAPLRSAF